MKVRRGFTLIELLVVIAIIALLVSILLPSLTRAREMARFAVCGTRLKGLGTALNMYASNNNDVFPSLVLGTTGNAPLLINANPSAQAQHMFYLTQANSNIQHYWLLVGEGFTSEDMFHCPSDDSWKDAEHSGTLNYGFSDWKNVSYGLQPASHHDQNKAFPGATGMQGGTIIAGDKRNKGEDPGDSATLNHEGGNYLTLTGSVSSSKDESGEVGVNGNNVFEVDMTVDGNSGAGSAPTNCNIPYHSDSYLFWTDGS